MQHTVIALVPLVSLLPCVCEVGEVEARLGVRLAVDGRALGLVHDLPRAEGRVVTQALGERRRERARK